MAARWDYVLNLKDVFHNEEMEFEQRRDEIVKRMKALLIDPDLEAWLHELADYVAESEDEDHFNYVWDDFYDWADDHRVWVATF